MTEVSISRLSDKIVPLLLILVIGMAFGMGIMWQKVANLEGGDKTSQVAGDTAPVDNLDPSPEAPNGKLTQEQFDRIPKISDDDHVQGSRDAEIILIEYSDFECPFCSRFHPTAEQAFKEYGDKIAWVYRHFPLTSIHANAKPAAEAAECVAEIDGEDAFWEFTKKMFEEEPLTKDSVAKIAGEMGIDIEALQSCIDSEKYSEFVDSQQTGGEQAGVTGTPGNFVINTNNGSAWLLPGAVPIETLKSAIDEALK